MRHKKEVFVLTVNEASKVWGTATQYRKPRLITIQGRRIRISTVNPIGAFFFRSPKVVAVLWFEE